MSPNIQQQTKSEEKTPFKTHSLGERLILRLLTWLGHPTPITTQNSVLYTFDKNMKYYPIQDEASIPISAQLKWVFIYTILWALTVFALLPGKTLNHTNAYLFGYLSGLFIMLLDSWLYSNINVIEIASNTGKPYIFNNPEIQDVNSNTIGPKDNLNDFMKFDYGSGDYKLITKNRAFKTPSDHEGYVIRSDDFLRYENSGQIEAQSLINYLDSPRNPDDPDNRKAHTLFNPGKQDSIVSFSQKIQDVINAAYYVGILTVTWGIYITTSKWGNKYHILWLMLTLVTVVIIAGVVNDGYTVIDYNNILFVKKRLLILAISFASTSILIP